MVDLLLFMCYSGVKSCYIESNYKGNSMLKIAIFSILTLFLFTKYTEASIPRKMTASWYMCCGKYTANGERFNSSGLTGAHKFLPFGTKLKLTYKGRKIIIRINDRGPFVKGRQLDLARGAANKLHCPGICQLIAEVLP